jgi:A/G-specific adenine glycosylase
MDPTQEKVKQNQFRRAVLRWHRQHQRSFPWRESRDPYEVLIGEILLQRTRGEYVVDVYREFLKRWPDPRSLARARLSSVASVIRPLGLAKRASILKQLGKELVRSGVPNDPSELDRLPGVGPYAAHAVPVFTLDRKLPLVDWVIARVLRRYFGLSEERRPNADPELWELAGRLAAKGKARELWLGTLDFAAAICKPRPACPTCPLAFTCAFEIASQERATITRL